MMSHLTDPEVIECTPQRTIGVRGSVPMLEMRRFIDSSNTALTEALVAAGVEPTRAPFCRYYSIPAETVDVEFGIPVDEEVPVFGDVTMGNLPEGRAVRATHVGSYDGLAESWQKLGAWFEEQGLRPSMDMVETYVDDPSDTDSGSVRTELLWMIAE